MKELKQIKEAVAEIVDIVKACPENLQLKCFETLLEHYLSGRETPPRDQNPPPSPPGEKKALEGKSTDAAAALEETASQQEDLKDSDLHVKVKKFLQTEKLTVKELNNIFYKEGDKILPLYDDLKTTKMAESQTRVALLQSLKRAIETGEFQSDIDAIRQECDQRKCNDKANFLANFRNNKALFDDQTIDRETTSLRLSSIGKQKLGELVRELQ